MSKRNFQGKVKNWIESNTNSYCVIFNASGISRVGVPDLICCIEGVFVGIEVKKGKDITSPLQEYNLKEIEKAGGLSYVVYPETFDMLQNEIIERFKRR